MPCPPEFPEFSDLPLDPTHPPHAAWGVWGEKDRLGTLNHLTPDRVVQAVTEVRTGVRIGLNLPLKQNFLRPSFRSPPTHEIYSIAHNMHDDCIQFNTQTSSQWDGFGHCGYVDGLFYNGTTAAQVRSVNSPIGIEAWSHQGIVGRGVLVDFARYAKRHNLSYNPTSRAEITLNQLQSVAEECRINFRPGDILILRTGFVQACQAKSYDEQQKMSLENPGQYPGLSSSVETLRWLWDNKFAACCGDCPSFEAWPPKGCSMHETLLAGFGMPIGELFDLDELARHCEAVQRWTFLVTSSPLNIEGGVASPPNALAIL